MSSPVAKTPSSHSRRRRRDSHGGNKKKSPEATPKSSIISPSQPRNIHDDIPSSSSSWRVDRSTTADKENNNKTKAAKSYGISPSHFHKKQQDHEETNANNCYPWKHVIETNLLIQQHEQYKQRLEMQRKSYKHSTQLKTWPLQDMAMEHLRHMLGSQSHKLYHGGDYLSSESSSSVESMSTKHKQYKTSITTIIVSPTTNGMDDDKQQQEIEAVNNAAESNNDGETPRSSVHSKGDVFHRRPTSDSETNDKNNKNDSSSSIKITDNLTTDQEIQIQSSSTASSSTSYLWHLEPRIFATEKANGKRKYLVGQFGRIADWYWRKTTTNKHLYEVITETTPCRLYLDLEYSKLHNDVELSTTNTVCAKLLLELFEELAIDLERHYGLRLRSEQIINLDSSNQTKFSRHWIVRMVDNNKEDNKDSKTDEEEEVLFEDAPTVGRFVKRLVSRLAEEIAVEGGDFAQRRPTLAKYLFVNTKDPGKKTCFIDLGVYTRNRLFRCLGSSKFGKSTSLHVMLKEEGLTGAESQQLKYFPLDLPPKRETVSSQTATKPLSMEEFVAANDWEPHAKALAESLVVPLREWPCSDSSTNGGTKGRKNRILKVNDEFYGGLTAGNLAAAVNGNRRGPSSYQQRSSPAVSMARQGSQLPSLDRYVNDILGSRGGVSGSIRAWSVEYGPRDTPISITYHMQKNRFCELIGRSHKSNNVFWTVDLTSWTCIQGCHDPDCFGRGSPIHIPNDAGRLDKIQEEFEAWQEEEFEKALMALNIDDIVAKAKLPTSEVQQTDRIEAGKAATDGDDLSDEALMQAIMNNPELFP
jgi:hypothetical protein